MRLMLMDGNFFLYHACYGARARLRKRNPTEGQLVARGVTVFWSILRSVIQRTSPTHLIVAFDGSESTFRHQLDPRYKSRRRERPPEMPALKRAVYRLLKNRGVFFYIAHDVEADDVIGTFARLGVNAGFQVIICSGDNDLAQLVQPGVELHLVRSGRINRPTVINAENFRSYYPVLPEQIPDWKALLGDRSDTIAGVPRMTQAIAADLLERYGRVADVLEAQDLRGFEKRLIAGNREHIERNLVLTRIRTDVDLYANWRRFEVGRIDLTSAENRKAHTRKREGDHLAAQA